MEITTRERDGVRILDLVGRLALGEGAKALYATARSELDSGHPWILLNLSQVPFIDSTGLGVLISCLTSASTRGGTLKLLRPLPKVEDVLKITQTDKLFEIFQDENRAVPSFQVKNREGRTPPAPELDQ